MRLGYVGLGNMGGALARRLMLAHKLTVFDTRAQVVQSFASEGAIPADSASAVGEASDLVMLCLPTSSEVREAVFGPRGVAEGIARGGIVADMTTGDPLATREMAKDAESLGFSLVDAPVSGGPHGAQAGTIAIMVGAPDDVYGRMEPAFRAISPNVFHVGGVGNGQTMKLVNNVIAAGVRQLTFEAVAMGVKNGLDLAACIEVLNKGSGRSYTSEIMLPRLLDGSLKATFTLGLMLKDVRLATELGLRSGAPMRLGGIVRENLLAALSQFGPDGDVNEIVRIYEREAGAKIVKE